VTTSGRVVLGARVTRRTAQVALGVAEGVREVDLGTRCVGCGTETDHVDARAGAVPRVQGSAPIEVTVRVPLCSSCAARDRRDQGLMLLAALAAGLFAVELALHRAAGGALALGLVAFLAAAALALAFGPVPSLSITAAPGGLMLAFRRRESARAVLRAHAADREAASLLASLDDRG
jgi:hypothetical protein